MRKITPCGVFGPFLVFTSVLLVAGCDRPSGGGGGQGDFSVSGVIAPVEERTLEEKIFLVGSLEAIEAIELVSEVDARVKEIHFVEGAPVGEGDLLIQLDARKLAAAVAEMQARYNLAKANLERSRTLLNRETISIQDFEQSEAEFDSATALLDLANELLDDASIRAPFDGVMTERLISLGQFMSRGQTLASLVAVDPLEVQFNVPERYISQLRMGQLIEFGVEAYPGEYFSGEVVFLSPRVDRESRTVLVKAEIPNRDQRLKPGMFGRIELVFKAREKALVIPEAAISYANDDASVVVMDSEDKAQFRQVQVGFRLAGQVEIVSGLQAGERVVVEGYQKMRPGSSIRISADSRRYGIDPENN